MEYGCIREIGKSRGVIFTVQSQISFFWQL
jgi:hypothetical protein